MSASHLALAAVLLAVPLIATPLAAQESWEWNPLEREWELHQPVRGQEVERGQDRGGAPEEGEEWYGPGAVPDDELTVDREGGAGRDHWLEGLWYDEASGDDHDDTLRYGYHYDARENRWEYGWYADDGARPQHGDRDGGRAEQLTGTVLGLRRLRAAPGGEPTRVVLSLRTDDGRVAHVALGDTGEGNRPLPVLSPGEAVAVGGEFVRVDGQLVLQAQVLRKGTDARLSPERWAAVVRGEITAVERVVVQRGEAEAVVAMVRDERGQVQPVLIGEPRAVADVGATLRPDTRVRVQGVRRDVDGRSTFFARDLQVLDRPTAQAGPDRAPGQRRDGVRGRGEAGPPRQARPPGQQPQQQGPPPQQPQEPPQRPSPRQQQEPPQQEPQPPSPPPQEAPQQH